jgi:hypothetical protein
MDGHNNRQVQAVDLRKKRWHKKRQLNVSKKPHSKRFITGTLVLAVILGAVVIIQNQRAIARNVCNGRENNASYARFAGVLYANKVDELQSSVQEILVTKNYQKDANCLFVASMYYVYKGDVVKAQSYNEKLTARYDPKTGYVAAFDKVAQTPQQIETQISYIQKRNAEFTTNARFTD